DLSGYSGRSFDPSKYVFGSQSASENRYFPTTIASDPAPGQLGTGKARIGQLRGFGTDREDIALRKYFRVGERYSLDFAVEFYNVLNRHAFLDPDSSSPNSATFGMVTGT